MPSDPRTIRGPCFDCNEALDDAWEFCPCRRDTPDYWRTWELLAKQLPLLCLALLCLSGCLTAAKIGQWQRAVYGWGMDPKASKPCQVASAEASAYLANANQRLAEAGKLTDLASDSQAKELVNSAAMACGKETP